MDKILIINYVLKAVDIFIWILFIRVILSWLPNIHNAFTEIIYKITEPVLRLCRIVVPIGAARLDLAPLIAYFALGILKRVIIYLGYNYF
ncbi:MAG: YggT family protein [Fusobacteriaceae bacterium]